MIKPAISLSIINVSFAACQLKTKTKNQTSTNAFKKGIATPKDFTNTKCDTIKVLSWNLEHFIDIYDNPYLENRRENTSYKMENRVSLLVQEFEHVKFLKQIAQDSLAEMYCKFFADGESKLIYKRGVDE